MTKINKVLDAYFRGNSISKTDPLTLDILGKISDIDICREYHIPYSQSLEDLEIWEYRLLSLYSQKRRFWEKKQNKTPSP